MSKRRPTVQLTRDNYENEEECTEVEPTNEPQLASQEILRNRPIIKAKRRLASDGGGDGSESLAANLFTNFKSTFGSADPSSTIGKFSFGSFNASSTTSAIATPFSNSTTLTGLSPSVPATVPASINKENGETGGFSLSNNSSSSGKTETTTSSALTETKADDAYSANLSKLNTIFYEHVKKYMDSSMVYDFTVVCQEYINQCKTIKDTKSQTANSTVVNNVNNDLDKKKNDSSSLFTFGQKSTESNATTFKAPPSTFSFGQASSASTSFGSATESKPGFSFGAGAFTSTPFSSFKPPVVNASDTGAVTEGGAGEEEDEAPPKVASVEHSEEGAVFTKKCKLYYQKDGSFVDKGLGFLYIKPKKDAKAQLLIRADTTTGNILLNIALVESLPVIKAEKGKGVMLTCIPNPEIEPKKKEEEQENGTEKSTVTFLIRVKATDNDELYDSIVKYKSQA